MKISLIILLIGIVVVSASTNDSVSGSSIVSTSLTSLTTTSSISTPTTILPFTTASLALSSSPPLPTQAYNIQDERPLMINQLNSQRSGMHQPLLCQDSLLTSLAQQHANDMAALDQLAHDLSCSSPAIPSQFCSRANRLDPYGPAVENIVALSGNDGSAAAAMAQFNASPHKFSIIMNPDYLYVGVGMAMNAVSGTYYWTQVFSTGNYQGVNCTFEPVVTVIDAFNRTSTFHQPLGELKLSLYPAGIADNSSDSLNSPSTNNHNFFCTLIPNPAGTSASPIPLGQLPYPTISFIPKPTTTTNASSDIMNAFNSALQQASATIIGPSSQILIPTILPTTTTTSTTTLLNPASLLATFTPTNASQSSLASAMASIIADPSFSSIMANPTISAEAIQMAQFLAIVATPSTTTTNATTTTSTSAI